MSVPGATGIFASKGLRVIVAVGLTVAFTGYVVGLRESRVESQRGAVYGLGRAESPTGAKAPAIVSYSQIGTKKLGPNRDWKTSLTTLAQPAAVPPPKRASSAEERTQIVAERSARRAFDGAPPHIPHPTTPTSVSACLACHEKGLAIGGKVASRMSHPLYVNCTQCHVEAAAPESEAPKNSFLAIKAGLGERASPGAPPAMPHPVWMRNDCQSCHGPTGPAALRTTHPERQSCLQCHAATSPLDTTPIARQSTRASR